VANVAISGCHIIGPSFVEDNRNILLVRQNTPRCSRGTPVALSSGSPVLTGTHPVSVRLMQRGGATMKRSFLAIFVLLGVTWSVAGSAYPCHIRVNGVCMSPRQISALEQHACATIPSGSYWLDLNTGRWGYEGGPAQGRLGDACGWGGTSRRTPGGDIIGDCYYDPQTGCSVCPGKGVSC
jgi:hypothetical protein